MANYYTNKISDIVGSKENVKVAIIGLSYRGGVKEKAYSGSFLLINALKNKGYTVYGVDPLYNSTEIMDIFDIDSIMINNIHEMDGIILLNKINQYKDQLLNNKDKVVDIKNVLGG